jgi:hypothetical protein
METKVKWNISKNLSPQKDVKTPIINNHLGHTWYGFKTYKKFPLVILQVRRLVVLVSFHLIEWKLCFVGMNIVLGQKTTVKTPTT